jgi:PAS domain S-box-containing protein
MTDGSPKKAIKRLLPRIEALLEDINLVPPHMRDQMMRVLDDLRDIDESMEAVLTEMENEVRRYQNLFFFAPDGYLLTDPRGTILEANNAIGAALHVHPNDLKGRHLMDFIESSDHGIFQIELNRLTEGLPLRNRELHMQPVKGKAFAAALNVSPLSGPVKRPVILRWSIRDVTERRLAEQERDRLLQQIDEERHHLREVLEQMPVGVIIAEAPGGRLVLTNEKMKEIWRYPILPGGAMQNDERYQGYHLDWRPYDVKEWPLARSFATGEVVINEEIEILRGDGSRGYVSVCSAPIRDSQGLVCYGIVTFSDITGQKSGEGNGTPLWRQ